MLRELYDETLLQITKTPENWQRFLHSAGRHYQVPFDEQVLIHAQRPEARRVMTLQQWNERNYWIKRGTAGIAVFERPYNTHAIRYYFDQSDAYVGRSYTGIAIPEFILSEQEKAYITGNLRSKGQYKHCQNFAEAIQYTVRETTQEAISQYKNRLAEILPQEADRALEEQKRLVRLLRESVNYALLSRLAPESLGSLSLQHRHINFEERNFAAISNYRDKRSINTLGICLSYTEKKVIQNLMLLQKQAREKFAQAGIIGYSENNKENLRNTMNQAQGQPERGQDNDNNNTDNKASSRNGNNISRGGRNFVSGLSSGEDSAGGKIRQSQTELSGEVSGFNLSEPADIGRIEPTLEGDRRTSGGNERAFNDADGESRGDYSRAENERSAGMGSANEQSASQSKRDNLLRPHLRRRSGITYGLVTKPNKWQKKEALLKEKVSAIAISKEVPITLKDSDKNGEQSQNTAENFVGRIDYADNTIASVENKWVQAAIEDLFKHHFALNPPQQKEWTKKWTAEMVQNLSSTLQGEAQQLHTEPDQSQNISYGLTANGLKVWAGDEAAPTQESVFSWALTAELLNHIIQAQEQKQTQEQTQIQTQEQEQAFIAENKLTDLTAQSPMQTQQFFQTESQPQSRQLTLFEDFSGFAEDTIVKTLVHSPDTIPTTQKESQNTEELLNTAPDFDLEGNLSILSSANSAVTTAPQEKKLPYAVGDTVYLDNIAFIITEIGDWNIALQDPTLYYPIFRSESKERFHHLLKQDSRNQAIIEAIDREREKASATVENAIDTKIANTATVIDTINAEIVNAAVQETSQNTTANLAVSVTQEVLSETIAAANNHKPAEIADVESAETVILSTQLVDYRLPDKAFTGTPLQKFQANLTAIRTLKQIEAEQRIAGDEEKTILAQYTGWGGLADYFEPTKNGYEELKALLTEEEYAAARNSTLTAFYTDNRYTDAIWQALVQMGFTGGNILEIILLSLIQCRGIIKKCSFAV